MGILGLILVILLFVLMLGLNKAHREATGVSMPSTNARRGMRRNARKKGISEQEAYEQWLGRKQKLERVFSGAPAPIKHVISDSKRDRLTKYFHHLTDKLDIRLSDVMYVPGSTTSTCDAEFRCRNCGNHELDSPKNTTETSIMICQICSVELGRWGEIKASAKAFSEAHLTS